MCRLLPDLGSDLANTETHSRQIKRSTDQIERRGSRSGAYCPDRVPCLELGEIEPLQSLGENHCQSRKDMASKLLSERAGDCDENFPETSKLAEPAIPDLDSV